MNFIDAEVKEGMLYIGDNIIDLYAIADKEVVEKYDREEVAFGFRPEAIKLIKSDEDARKAYKIDCTVELTELLGDNTNVYVDIHGIKTILKVDPHDSPAVDSKLQFAIPFESVYLFDKATEKRIQLKKEV